VNLVNPVEWLWVCRFYAFGLSSYQNIIFHAVKNGERTRVLISSSQGPATESMTLREVEYEQVVRPDDPDLIIHIATSEMDQFVLDRLEVLQHSLDDLGIAVSTGRVVDFRARDALRANPDEGAACFSELDAGR
jgi:adenine-specific DNA-methyltransferase